MDVGRLGGESLPPMKFQISKVYRPMLDAKTKPVIFFFWKVWSDPPSSRKINNHKTVKMVTATKALTTKVASGTPYQLDDSQVLFLWHNVWMKILANRCIDRFFEPRMRFCVTSSPNKETKRRLPRRKHWLETTMMSPMLKDHRLQVSSYGSSWQLRSTWSIRTVWNPAKSAFLTPWINRLPWTYVLSLPTRNVQSKILSPILSSHLSFHPVSPKLSVLRN